MDAIARFCNNLILESSMADHHGEASWLLWICKELTINLEADVVKEVIRMGSPVCTLILLDLSNSGIVTVRIPKRQFSQTTVPTALYSPEWLLSYEAGRRKWLGNKNIKHIAGNVFFDALRKAGVQFYDDTRRITPIFDFKIPPESPSQFDWDSDDEIESSFEFDENDEEYFDSSPTPDDFENLDELDL
jgi:hypothetical protein